MTDTKRERFYTPIGKHSLTKQEFKDECCIENIMNQYKQTGQITHGNKQPPTYDDFSNVVTYQEAQNITIQANEAFMALPSGIRNQFHNDPGAFLDFATNEDNHDQMVTMGLATAKPQPAKQEPAPAAKTKAKTPAKAPPDPEELPGTD